MIEIPSSKEEKNLFLPQSGTVRNLRWVPPLPPPPPPSLP